MNARKRKELLAECLRAISAGVVVTWRDWRAMSELERAAWIAAREEIGEGPVTSASGWEPTTPKAAEFLAAVERARGG